MDKFAKNARFLRHVNGYSQQEIAGLLHISRSAYFSLECGKTALSLEQVLTLSSFYGVNPECFIFFDISQQLLSVMAIGHENIVPVSLAILQKNIKLLRTTKGLSQEKVSSYLHISRSTYSAYESGAKTPDLHTLICLAALFECDLNDLLHKYHHEKV